MRKQQSRRDILKASATLAAAGLAGKRAAAAPGDARGHGAATLAHIDDILRAATVAEDVPGVVAMAANETGIVYEGAFGSRRVGGGASPVTPKHSSKGTAKETKGTASAAHMEAPKEAPKNIPMTRDTVFRVASMVKLITTVAALQLVEQGKLDLDAPAPAIDPALADPQVLDGFDAAGKPIVRPPKRPILLRHLLTHTSGFSYPLWDATAVRYIAARERLKPAERAKLPHLPLMFDPGDGWHYGPSINWVGRIVEATSGVPLPTHLHNAIFAPLGMTDTGATITPAQQAREACGHHRRTDGTLVAEPMAAAPAHSPPPTPHTFSGGGGIYSSAPDYLTLLRALLHGGTLDGVRILRPETVALMGENQIGAVEVSPMRTTRPALSSDVDFFPGIGLKWGYGHMITMQPVPEGRSAGSLTWAGLYNTYYWIDPKQRLCAVFMTQVLPFADARPLRAYRAFERGLYAAVRAGYVKAG